MRKLLKKTTKVRKRKVDIVKRKLYLFTIHVIFYDRK